MEHRRASHAGSWYTDDEKKLNERLDEFLHKVPRTTDKGDTYPIRHTRAIIGPHAGYDYSGPTAAYAYKCVDISSIKRVFLLGPSHHVYLDGCALSSCDTFETPLGSLTLDQQVTEALFSTRKFKRMSRQVDEDEHSIEMHLPFVYKIFSEKINDIRVIPILVGSIGKEKEDLYGEILAPYLADPENLFIVSSDFCHWGRRFSYTYYKPTQTDAHETSLNSRNEDIISTPIHASIHALDHEGMNAIESMNLDAFRDYLERTQNTICGRHPIAVLMSALASGHNKRASKKVQFVHYDQSSQCEQVKDSSVSYASAFVSIIPDAH